MIASHSEAINAGEVKRGRAMTSWVTRLEMALVGMLLIILTGLATMPVWRH
jgi:hypothetical protein